jgi:hypothetical protein
VFKERSINDRLRDGLASASNEPKKGPAHGPNGKPSKTQRGVVAPPRSSDSYAVVLTRVPIDPEVALGCSTLLAVLPS